MALLPGVVAANDAEIVLLIGKGDARESADAPWRPAAVKQKLVAGAFVRTGEMSQMGLLLRDRTQVRLNQLSILNIKSVVTGEPPPPTRLELPQGRAWSQVKPKTPGETAARKQPALEVTMPAGTAIIRGTDWELVADKDGTSTVIVLSGEIEFFNEHGRVSVLPNERARAVPGKSPVKTLLTNAAERVQWVTSYRPQPRRWVQDLSGSIGPIVKAIEAEDYPAAFEALNRDQELARRDVRAALLLADLYLFQGQADDALRVLGPHANDGRGHPVAAALLVRAYIVAGRLTDAARVLENAEKQQQRNLIELLLSEAELARVQGDAARARRASLKALEIDPKNAEAWYLFGRIETEREFVAAAREALKRAIALRPDGPGYQGELGTLETFASEFAAADKAFQEALARQPDDYVALTGLGVLQLKRGETGAALESFLKAGLIEPRYARAWLFSGAAYYQLGDRVRALESFAKASSLDDKDPLPHLVTSLVHFDSLELGRAIESARAAQARMPFLKSLNQVLTDQKGNANVGSALAAFGLEEWSQAYAYNSYSPYWAGSHLFLSDRFAGTFNQNSELFKGFLSDPAVFGASNRHSAIVPAPGHYGALEASVSRDYFTETGASVVLNGYSTAATPLSYFAGYDKSYGDSAINRTKADGRMRAEGDNLVAGLGLRPSHEIGLFTFFNATGYDGRIADRASGLTGDDFSYKYYRLDAGMNYKFSPVSHAWLKIGGGTEEVPVSGEFFSQPVADALNAALGTAVGPAGRLNLFRSDTTQYDLQWRHTFDLDPDVQLSWGLEYAKSEKPFFLSIGFAPVRLDLNQDNRLSSAGAYLSGRFRVSDTLGAQLDLHYQDTRTGFSTSQVLDNAGAITTFTNTGGTRYHELNPRFGLVWRPSEAQTVRAAAQVWRRPASVSTLGPVDTAGIPLDDRIERDGGRLKRARVQHEMEWGKAMFVQWFADAKRIENPDAAGAGVVPDLELEQLQRLRARQRFYGIRQDYLEDTPKFGAGRVNSAGVAVNRLLGRDTSVAARYVYAETRNTTAAFQGLEVPYHPRHYLNFAASWQPRPRWIVGPVATYRSARYTDEANAVPLTAGWSLGFHAYWESEDKRWSLGAVLDQVHSDKKSSIYRHPVAVFKATYRF